jgi:D-alanyl-D-alanine carboxypeptidase
MSHSQSDHSFDWTGFRFSLQLITFFVVAGSAIHYTLLYAQTVSFSDVPPPTYYRAPARIPIAISTSTPKRVIKSLTIDDVVPLTGKFMVADLSAMKLTLYRDGTSTAEYVIQTKGKPGTPWETPAGFYTIQTKEENHFSTIGHVNMPYSMQFYGNYFIHGWPTYDDGTPVASTYSGGCIRLNTSDAKQVYDFADTHTGLFVYDPHTNTSASSIPLGNVPAPMISAQSYLVADVDSGDVYLEHNAQTPLPIASISKLITALVANETISFDKKISVNEGYVLPKANPNNKRPKKFLVGDLLYPLLMESSNGVAEALADYYGTPGFIHWMNTTALSLDMQSTHFAEPTGLSPENISTSDDLFRLAVYLAHKKPFIWDITRTPTKKIVSDDGSAYPLANFNKFIDRPDFIGGKVGYTDEADHTMVSLFSFKIGDQTRRVAFIVLHSADQTEDIKKLVAWFEKSVIRGTNATDAACASCAKPQQYRKIAI